MALRALLQRDDPGVASGEDLDRRLRGHAPSARAH